MLYKSVIWGWWWLYKASKLQQVVFTGILWWLRHPRKVKRHHTAVGFIWPSVETANDNGMYHHSHQPLNT